MKVETEVAKQTVGALCRRAFEPVDDNIFIDVLRRLGERSGQAGSKEELGPSPVLADA
jgi:hypothetical protein